MALSHMKYFIATILLGLVLSECFAKSINKPQTKLVKNPLDKLLILQKQETTPANFSRLLAMRLIYGLASMMGLRDRITGMLNGAFVPPGADDDDYDLDLDDDEGPDFGGFFDL